MTWNEYIWFAVAALALWVSGAVVSFRLHGSVRTAVVLTTGGLCVYASFILGMWDSLGRPPLRTLGETRLWYSFFMMVSGLATYCRWRYRWILPLSVVLAAVFVFVNLLKPELHSQYMMPALQSFWFVPHVTVYMFSYSLLGCAFILAVVDMCSRPAGYLSAADRLVAVGLAFLTFGMLSGALWAKDAWGYYWSWDPKETWAAVTWGVYVLYLHLRLYGKGRLWPRLLIVMGFVCMQMCWYGVNYLPSAQESMHTYSTMGG